ncbi:MAG TPA: hypothetical protein VEQ85_12630 [Lacipirellulaceae bacterium]|nr:hypothetical protein [Lacipirellulaceae bacterium]
MRQHLSDARCWAMAAIVLSVPLGPGADWARAQHSDILLTNIAGQTAVGAAIDIDGPAESFDLAARTFESILRVGSAPPVPADYEAAEPGVFALHAAGDAAVLAGLGASALPAGAAASAAPIAFPLGSQAASLYYWNGLGAVDFQPVVLAQPGVEFAISPGSFGVTGAQGDLDDHPLLQVTGPGVPADGVYLSAARFSVAGLQPSEPIYLVMLVDALILGEDQGEAVEEALAAFELGAANAVVAFAGGPTKDFAFFEEAVEWVELSVAVPEPGTSGLAVLACLLVGRRRSGGTPT